MLAGRMPFWYMDLDEETFTLRRDYLKDNEGIKSVRFPVCLDGHNQRFLRITNAQEVFIYDKTRESWRSYHQQGDTALDMVNLLQVSALKESYGRNGRWAAAMESPLTLYADQGICMAKLTIPGPSTTTYQFFQILFNLENNSFTFRRKASVTIPKLTMFYISCSPNYVAIMDMSNIMIIPIQAPSLSEIAIWKIQQMAAKKTITGAHCTGLTIKNFHELMRDQKFGTLL
ncbi:unnamed protein product, partial [Mesorhabditis spiculigera]